MPIEIRRKDVKTLVAQGRAHLVDVRSCDEFAREHLPQAISIPLECLGPLTLEQLQKNEAVIVYSADSLCDLSARAAWLLESMGFQDVYRFSAGKADWIAAGWETEGTSRKETRIQKIIRQDVLVCSPRETLAAVKLRRRVADDFCIVLNQNSIVLGIIRGETWNANSAARAIDVMERAPRTIRPHLSLKDAHTALRGYGEPYAIVTTSDGEFMGVVRIKQKKDVALEGTFVENQA